METAPRNCRFLSLVVVERVLMGPLSFRGLSRFFLGGGGGFSSLALLKGTARNILGTQNSQVVLFDPEDALQGRGRTHAKGGSYS